MPATYIGSLRGVELADGTYVPVRARALGVADGIGAVTSDSRRSLERETFDHRPGTRRGTRIRSLYYYRRRPEGDWWQHETPDARVVLTESSGDRPDAWVDSPGSEVVQPGDFLSNPPHNSKDLAMARARRKLPPRTKTGQFRRRKKPTRRRKTTRRRSTRRRSTRRRARKNPATRTVYKTRWRTRKPARRRKPAKRPRARKNPMSPLLLGAMVAAAATIMQGLIRTYITNPMLREYLPPGAMLIGGYMLHKKQKTRNIGYALTICGAADLASIVAARLLPQATVPSSEAPAATQGGFANIAGGRWGGAFPTGGMFPPVAGVGSNPLLLQNNLPLIADVESFADFHPRAPLVAL